MILHIRFVCPRMHSNHFMIVFSHRAVVQWWRCFFLVADLNCLWILVFIRWIMDRLHFHHRRKSRQHNSNSSNGAISIGKGELLSSQVEYLSLTSAQIGLQETNREREHTYAIRALRQPGVAISQRFNKRKSVDVEGNQRALIRTDDIDWVKLDVDFTEKTASPGPRTRISRMNASLFIFVYEYVCSDSLELKRATQIYKSRIEKRKRVVTCIRAEREKNIQSDLTDMYHNVSLVYKEWMHEWHTNCLDERQREKREWMTLIQERVEVWSFPFRAKTRMNNMRREREREIKDMKLFGSILVRIEDGICSWRQVDILKIFMPDKI